jgi:hypothetical protein
MKWVGSSFCDTGQCLEVGICPKDGYILVRNTSNPDEEEAAFHPAEWPFFLAGVKGDGPMWDWFRDQDEVTYSLEDAQAFKAGVLAGEFDYDKLPVIDEG